MHLKQKLGMRIQELRKLLKYSQESFSEKIGIEWTSIGKIETGLTYPKPETLEKIKEALGVEYKDLFIFEQTKDDRLDDIYMKLKMLDDTALDFVNAVIETYIKNKV